MNEKALLKLIEKIRNPLGEKVANYKGIDVFVSDRVPKGEMWFMSIDDKKQDWELGE